LFCTNCGNKAEGSEAFCSQCGTPLEQSATGKSSGTTSKQLLPLGIVGGALVIVLLLVFLLVGEDHHDSPEAVVDAYLEAGKEGDSEQLFDLVPPSELEQIKEDTGEDAAEIKENFIESHRETLEGEEQLREELNFTIESEIKETEKENGQATTEVINTISFEMEGEETEDEETQYIDTVKEDGKWYLELTELERLGGHFF